MTPAGRKPRVLLVDDEQDITTPLSRALEVHGCEVETFNDPVTAAHHFMPNYYDNCVLDIRMPQKTGIELARDIWRLDEKAQVCFLTSFISYEDEARRLFKHLNSPCFLRKPLTPSALVAHVENHIEKLAPSH